jgi:hypothetical protein
MPTADEAVTQLSNLLTEYEPQITEGAYGAAYIDEPNVAQGTAVTRLSAGLDRFAPRGSSYQEEASRIQERGHHSSQRAVELLGVVRALRADYEAGYMRSVEELVHADLFSDFLDMAKELLDKGFKDPAAVVAGSVLEGHLRQLAAKNDIPTENEEGKPRKAEALNADLAKADYGKGEQKSVTAWLDLRNHAAHGHYEKYEASQVALLIDSVRDFMVRHAA